MKVCLTASKLADIIIAMNKMQGKKYGIDCDSSAPEYYLVGGIEVNAVCRAKLTQQEYLGWLKGNMIKYTLRAPWKETDQTKDLKKVVRYAEFLETFLSELDNTQAI